MCPFNKLHPVTMRERAYVPEKRGGDYEERGDEYEKTGRATNKPLFQGPAGHLADLEAGQDMRKWA